ncbi:contact-dependent growth inhibition system immunity protein [Rufibacter immobilis]|uniref:contact-dependent growth inhibition system immunity protein n=1 Tax=Rufibacter immobilis TaxID=1348778 RepID=UPI0035EFAFF5
MEYENNILNKTLEDLEGKIWPPVNSSDSSHLVITCHALRKKKLSTFSIEDLRIMIGQGVGLKYMIPLAIEILRNNILAEGDLYEGDLLMKVLVSDQTYWLEEKGNWSTVCILFNHNRKVLEDSDTSRDIKQGWLKSFEAFEQIHKES